MYMKIYDDICKLFNNTLNLEALPCRHWRPVANVRVVCPSSLRSSSSEQQDSFDTDVNDLTGVVKTNTALEMLMAAFKEQ